MLVNSKDGWTNTTMKRDPQDERYRAQRVSVYRDVREIRLHSFKIDYTTLEGTFRADFDRRECPDAFPFVFDTQGRLCVCLPMIDYHHTELLTTVEMPAAAKQALQSAIESLFPDIKPYGRTITFQTAIAKRVPSPDYLTRLKTTVGRTGFEHRVTVPS
jgi:hypothetical protein